MLKRQKNFCWILAAIIFSGCSNIKNNLPINPINKNESELNYALESRGFYKTKRGNINYLTDNHCGGFELKSHRGSIRYPENSTAAVIDSLDNDFDVVGVDVRLTYDNIWVVHHDSRTGRETGTVDNKRRRIDSIRYKREWGYLRIRDQNTGELLDEVPPSFYNMAIAFRDNAKNGQRLNIEIKGLVRAGDLVVLDHLAKQIIGNGQYFYSSLDLKNLSRLRKINSDVFLSFIQSPTKESVRVLKNNIKRGVKNDSLYLRNQEILDKVEKISMRRYREVRYDKPWGFRELKNQLKNNYGLTIDIRRYKANSSLIKSLAREYAIPLSTYTINGHDYHSDSLLGLHVKNRPDSVIIDDTVYGFCSQYNLPQLKSYAGETAMAKRIGQLPVDLDLERLDEIDIYFDNGLYPSVSGLIKAIKKINKRSSAVILLNTNAGPKETEQVLNLEVEAIRVELRRGK